MPKKKQYIGMEEIKGIKDNVVTFANGAEQEFTEKQLSYIVVDEPMDLTAQRDLLLAKIVPEFMKIIEDHDVRNGDLTTVLQSVGTTYNTTMDIAIGKAMGTFVEGKHPDSILEDIRMSHIKKAF